MSKTIVIRNGKHGPNWLFFFITWVPKIIRTQSTQACMKDKQKSSRNHKIVQVKDLLFCLVMNLRISDGNCLIFNCRKSRAAPGISFIRVSAKDDEYSINWGNNIGGSYYSWYGDEGILKRKIKNRTFWVAISSRKHDLS